MKYGLWAVFAVILILAALVITGVISASHAQAQSANGTGTANSQSGSSSFSGASNHFSTYSKGVRNTPSAIAGGGSPSPRTCAAAMGAGIGIPGFGVSLNAPVTMRGCAVERAFGMVKGIPGLTRQQQKEALIQVACQDKYAGAALTATGQTCLVGRYRNRRAANVASVNYARKQSGARPAPSQNGPFWWSKQCTARQQVIYINGMEKPCR